MGNWISRSRFSGWMAVVWAAAVLWVGVGCAGGEAGGADADAAVAEIAGRAMAEVECVAKNSECLKATWTNLGTCEVEVKSGGRCGTGTSVCSGTCSAAGTCVWPGAEQHCGNPATPCSLCNGKGQCAINTTGAECTISTKPGQCFKSKATCGADGGCELTIDPGAGCAVDSGPCGAGICSATGICFRASEGKACTGATGICQKPDGTCDDGGTCVGTPDIGAACKPAGGVCGSGVCNADAVCVPVGPGSTCTTPTKEACRKLNGVCGVEGTCLGDIDVGAACTANSGNCGGICNAQGECAAALAGAPCASKDKDCPGICTATDGCVPVAGGDCTVKNGPCAGKPGICSTGGYCFGIDECAKPYIAVPTGDFAKGLSCIKMVGNIPAMPPANSGTCGNDGDPCKPKFCKILDSDWNFNCTAGQLNDGTPCPGEASNPCAASTCQAGKCTQAFKPVGTSCKPLAPALCAEFQCSSAGKCDPVAASVPLAAPCTVSDGDTDCWAKSCDGLGNCTKTPRAKGEHCGAELDNACAKFACDGKGRCLVELIATNGQCKDAKCLDFYAKPGTPCTGGPCTNNGCTSLGICATSYKPVGAPCNLFGYPGICDESHVCIWPAKVVGAIVGTTCYGTFPCMKEDVAYGADGICHGTVAVGAACGSLCNPGVCGADGTCQQAFAPQGVVCGSTNQCGKLVCDGKGGCAFPASAAGSSCDGGKPGECFKYACTTEGKCMQTAAPGGKCSTGNECQTGSCNANGQCVATNLSGNACALASTDECLTGVCANGTCTGTPLIGKACGKDTACMAYSCNASGQCAGTPKVGSSCESKETCKKGVCDASGQCKQELTPGAKCVGKQQCMEGTCSAIGGCEFTPKPAGSQCTAAAPGTDWSCYTGACDGKGGCDLKVNTGVSCKLPGQSDCMSGVCQSDASCKAVPANLGKACSAQCVVGGVCDSQGECSGKPATGESCYTQCIPEGKCSDKGKCTGPVQTGGKCGQTSDFAICQQNTCDINGACTTKNLPAGQACTVGATFSNATPSYACGSASGLCNGAGTCVSSKPDPDGTECGFDDGCAAAHVCKGGLCLPVEPHADQSPCKFGCAEGVCSAGGCLAPSHWTYFGYICDDGIECTYDFCWGSPLAGPAFYTDTVKPFSPGTCGAANNWALCPDGKPPITYQKCKDSDCGKDACGLQLYCRFSFGDKIGACGYNYNLLETFSSENQSNCDDKSSCTKDGCSGGWCVHEPVKEGQACAPFKRCLNGQCASWN